MYICTARTYEGSQSGQEMHLDSLGVDVVPEATREAVLRLPGVRIVSLSNTSGASNASGELKELGSRAQADSALRAQVAAEIGQIAERHGLPVVAVRGVAVLPEENNSYRRSLADTLSHGGIEYDTESRRTAVTYWSSPSEHGDGRIDAYTWLWAHRHTSQARISGETAWPGIIVFNPDYVAHSAADGCDVIADSQAAVLGVVVFDHVPEPSRDDF